MKGHVNHKVHLSGGSTAGEGLDAVASRGRCSVRSRSFSEVQAELKRRGELYKRVPEPISVWFFCETLDAFFLCRSRETGIWIEFATLHDFDDMHDYLQELNGKSNLDMSEFVSELTTLGSMEMILANPPYGT